MSMRNRLRRLEMQLPTNFDDRPPVVLGVIDRTDDDVIGMFAGPGSHIVAREVGESMESLIARARVLLATPGVGLPLIMWCYYTDSEAA
jgi:hypothetical protein